MVTKMEREAWFEQVRAKYTQFQEDKKAIRDVVRARLADEVEEASRERTEEFSKFVHEIHEKGLPWTEIAKACRKYGNADEFNKIRYAYQPDREIDLRTLPGVIAQAEKRGWVWVNDNTLRVTVETDEFEVGYVVRLTESVDAGDGEIEERTWDEFEVPEEFMHHYTAVGKLVREALDAREDEED